MAIDFISLVGVETPSSRSLEVIHSVTDALDAFVSGMDKEMAAICHFEFSSFAGQV
jgi:hypothetical protein